MNRNLIPFTQLKERGIKYIDSRSALQGRIGQDIQAMRLSGLTDIEASLEDFLVQEKGRAKLVGSLRPLRAVNREVRVKIPHRVGMLRTDLEILEERYRKASVPLETLETTKNLVTRSLERGIEQIGWEARDHADKYFLTLKDKIPGWSEQYEIETGFGFPPQIKPIVEEVLGHLTRLYRRTSRSGAELSSSRWFRNV
jgi:hypothetical protein